MQPDRSSPKRSKIKAIISSLSSIPKTSVTGNISNKEILITNVNKYVPDFKFIWSESMLHYRVYGLFGDGAGEKYMVTYAICTVGTGIVASGFVMLYAFLSKNRANNKT